MPNKVFVIDCKGRGIHRVVAESKRHAVAQMVVLFCSEEMDKSFSEKESRGFKPAEVIHWSIMEEKRK